MASNKCAKAPKIRATTEPNWFARNPKGTWVSWYKETWPDDDICAIWKLAQGLGPFCGGYFFATQGIGALAESFHTKVALSREAEGPEKEAKAVEYAEIVACSHVKLAETPWADVATEEYMCWMVNLGKRDWSGDRESWTPQKKREHSALNAYGEAWATLKGF